MKIVHILKGKANPDTLNGVNKVVHHLATEQLRLGIEVEVWGITANPTEIRHRHCYPLHLFPVTRSRFAPSKSLREAITSLSTEHTIVHLHSVFLPELYGVSRLLKKSGVPWVLSPHSGYASQSMKKNKLAKSVYMMLFEKKVISDAIRVHAIGASEVHDLKQFDNNLVVVLIPNGQAIEEVKFNPVQCMEPNEKPVFGFCGRLAKEHKGLDLLIQGFARYKNDEGKGELWLIGDGPDRAILQELAAKEGVNNSVRFFGKLFGDEKLTVLSKMDVFAHTSRWEGIPMAVLEAAALGKPLLVSKATNLGDYVKTYGNGIVLTDNTLEIICESLFEFGKLYAAQKVGRMGLKSIKLIEVELSWRNIAMAMLRKLYPQAEKV